MARRSAQELDTLTASRTRPSSGSAATATMASPIGDIARATTLSESTLCWHFSGRAELYLQCLDRLHALIREPIFDPMRCWRACCSAPMPGTGGCRRWRECRQYRSDPATLPASAGDQSRNSRRRIFPVTVLGSSGRNCTTRGYL